MPFRPMRDYDFTEVTDKEMDDLRRVVGRKNRFAELIEAMPLDKPVRFDLETAKEMETLRGGLRKALRMKPHLDVEIIGRTIPTPAVFCVRRPPRTIEMERAVEYCRQVGCHGLIDGKRVCGECGRSAA